MTASTTVAFFTAAPVVSTSAVYSDVETLFDTTVPAGSRVGYVVTQPPTWRGTVAFSDTRFVAAHFDGNSYTVNTTTTLPTATTYSMTMTTFP